MNFMKRENRITNKQLKKLFYGPDLEKLNSKDCEDYDVSFLFKLMPYICEGIEGYDGSARHGNEEKLEYLLLKLRLIRNSVMHEIKGASKSSYVMDEVVRLSFKVFEAASKKYSIPQEEIIQEMKMFMYEISKILSDFSEDEAVTYWENRHFLLQDGRKTLLAKLSPSEDNFVPLQLSFEERKFQSPQLLEHISSEMDKFFLIKGDGGAGKSSLLTDMNEKVLQGKSHSGNNAFDIPILIQSCDALYGTFEKFLKDRFTRHNPLDQMYLNASRPESGKDIIRALEKLKPLFLVDGFDDIDGNFLRDIIFLIKRISTAKCIITSRITFSIKLCSFLNNLRITSKIIEIPKISKRDDQIQFIRKSTNDDKKAFETYERLDLNLQTPSQLSHFARLYKNDAKKVESWPNGIPMMGEIVNEDKNKIMHYLYQKNVKNNRTIVNQIFAEVETLSFFCLLQNIEMIQDGLCEALEQSVYSKIKSTGVPIEVDDILTGLFSCEKNSSSASYEFYNDHHLQALAGMHLMKELSIGKGSIPEVIESSMKQFGRIHAEDTNCSYDVKQQKKMFVCFRF